MPSDHARTRITELLSDVRAGRRAAADELLPLVYEELRELARATFARERTGHTLQPTALVNEAWIRVAGDLGDLEDRRHFFGVAARAMRQVLTDHARRRNSQKRGGDRQRVTLNVGISGQTSDDIDLVDLDDALTRLKEINSRQASIAELRLFVGMSVDEVAVALGETKHVVAADWRLARAWLRDALAA